MTSSKLSRSIAVFVSGSEILLIFCATTLLAQAVDQISQGKATVSATLPAVVLYGICVYMSTVFNIGLGMWTGWEKIKSIDRNWNQFLPLKVTAKQKTLWERFFSSIWDQSPRISELELGICALIAQVTVVYGALSYRAFSQNRYELLFMSVPLLLMNLLANRIGVKPWHNAIQENQKVKAQFLGWHQRYFSMGSQAFRAWKLDEHKDFQKNWLGAQLSSATSGIRNLWKIQFLRLAAKSLLGDLPFYTGICVFLYLGIRGEISIGSVFFWLTMNELLFRANSNMRQILDRFVELKGLKESISLELKEFQKADTIAEATEVNEAVASKAGAPLSFPLTLVQDSFQIDLINGERIELHSNKGFQRLFASNGSGKSHLLRALAGEDLPLNGEAVKLRDRLQGLRTLTVEPEFESLGFKTLKEEVLGPAHFTEISEWPKESRLPLNLKDQWRSVLIKLIDKYPTGQDVQRASKGEKAMLSMARALTFIETMELVLVDEVDGPLAADYRKLVQETLEFYAKDARVIVVSHHARPAGQSLSQKGFLLGYDHKNDQGHVVPYVLRMTDDGVSTRKPLGNVAEGMMGLLELCLELLASLDPAYRSLKKMSFTLQCNIPGAKIGGIDSAGLGLVLALINLKRQLEGQKTFTGVAATGHIDLGGHVHGVAGLSKKREAALNAKLMNVISPDDIQFVKDLEVYLSAKHG